MLSALFTLMLAVGLVVTTATQGGDAATAAIMSAAGEAVRLCLELAGAYLLFLGVLGVARRAGLMESLSKALAPVIRFLFPRPGKASGAIALCLSANMLGLGNAATPFGLEAMRLLEEENPHPGRATDEMCVLVAVNASALQLLPTGLIALRKRSPRCARAALAACLPCRNTRRGRALPPVDRAKGQKTASGSRRAYRLYPFGDAGVSSAIVPLLIAGVVLYALIRGVNVYEAFAEGAAEGLPVLYRILPNLAAMLIAIGALRASGLVERFSALLSPLTNRIGLQSELLPLLFIRPFSGSAALAVVNDLFERFGPDSAIGMRASVLMGSSETIFYEVALYFGAVRVKRTRFAVPVALLSMAVGVIASLLLT